MPLPQNTNFYPKTPKSKGVKGVILQMSLYVHSPVNYKPQPKIKEQQESSKCMTTSCFNYS